MEKCPEYINGKVMEDYLLKNQVVFCDAEVCLYNKELTTTLSEENMTLCSSKAWLTKKELDNPNKDKKSNKPKVYPLCNLKEIGDLTKVEYLQFPTEQS